MRKTIKRLTAILLIFAMCFSIVTPVSAAAKKLTKKEKKYYSNVLWNQLYLDSYLSKQAQYFVLYDVNGDGRKELLVSDKSSGSMVYGYDGKNFHKAYLSGVVVGVSKKGVVTKDVNYNETCVYSVSKKCIGTLKLAYSNVGIARITKNGEKEISKSSYNKLYKKYKFKTVGKSVKKYSAKNKKTILKVLGVTASPKLADGIYYSEHNGSYFYDSSGKNRAQHYKACIKKSKDGKKYKLILYGNYMLQKDIFSRFRQTANIALQVMTMKIR
jgi:hypothetical protein